MAILLLVLDTFLNLRVVGYLAEEFPYIEGLFEALVFEVIVEYARYLYSVHYDQHDAGKKRNMELFSEYLTDHSCKSDPAYIVDKFVDGPSPFSGRSDDLTALACCKDSEPGVYDNEYECQHQERKKTFIEADEWGEEGSCGSSYNISVLHGYLFTPASLSAHLSVQ